MGKPWVLIIAASAVAHLWCLGSQFYLDDLWQIRDSDVIRENRFLETGLLAWTYLWYTIEARASGMSPVAFHAVNWLLHTAVACALYGSARDYVGGRAPAGTALFGAVLFAVHPLGSEIPNYARTQDLAWVTLFSLLAAWCLFRFLRDGGLGKLALSCACVLGATFSKGPGLMHAIVITGTVGVAFAGPQHWDYLRRKATLVAAGTLVAIVAAWKIGLFDSWSNGAPRWSEPRFVGHAFTLCRVFWEFAWRSVIPLGLSADHHIAETLVRTQSGTWEIRDSGAWWAAACLMFFTSVALVLAIRKSTRLIGVCLFLYAGAILLRFFYFVPEFMPEYRIYPGLPWFCLGAALILTRGWQALTRAPSRVPARGPVGTTILPVARPRRSDVRRPAAIPDPGSRRLGTAAERHRCRPLGRCD
jgi:hypothetical protein